MKGTFSKQTDTRAQGGKGIKNNMLPSKAQKKKQNVSQPTECIVSNY